MTNKLIKVSALTAALMAASSSVNAADQILIAPELPGVDWSGFYVGGHLGYGTSDPDWTEVCGSFVPPCVAPLVGRETIASPDLGGLVGGFQAGYNVQHGQWVFGAEAQVSFGGMDDCDRIIVPGIFPAPEGIGADACTDVKWMGSAAGRVGYAFGQFLPYLTGGLALAHEEHQILEPNGDIVTTAVSDTATGYMLGAGAEFMFADGWSAKLEYNYLDFGTDRFTLVNVNNGFVSDYNIERESHLIKLGVNYHF